MLDTRDLWVWKIGSAPCGIFVFVVRFRGRRCRPPSFSCLRSVGCSGGSPGRPKWRRSRPSAWLPLLADEPSIAVLPFANMSNVSAQEYFADDMTEGLITDLSKISNLTVISRTSTSGYKGRQIDIREVGEALGVQRQRRQQKPPGPRLAAQGPGGSAFHRTRHTDVSGEKPDGRS